MCQRTSRFVLKVDVFFQDEQLSAEIILSIYYLRNSHALFIPMAKELSAGKRPVLLGFSLSRHT